MYRLYMDGLLFPVPPSKINTKIKNRNKTINLINYGEVNLLKEVGLTEISFELLLPNQKYSFAEYEDRFKTSEVFLRKLEELKTRKEVFKLKILRNRGMFDTNQSVTLEDYSIKEDSQNGADIYVLIRLKFYKFYEAYKTEIKKGKKGLKKVRKRQRRNAPKPKEKNKVHKVKKGDCLWAIAKKYYGDGNKYKVIAEANKSKIKRPNLIFAGQELIIPVLKE